MGDALRVTLILFGLLAIGVGIFGKSPSDAAEKAPQAPQCQCRCQP